MKLLYLIILPFLIENPLRHTLKEAGAGLLWQLLKCVQYLFQHFAAVQKIKRFLYCDISLSVHSHACVIRGQVVTSDGTPLVGVNISFINSPSYGYTITRQDGR